MNGGLPRGGLSRGDHPLRVTTADQAAARDRAAIASGIPSFALMLQAGTHSAAVILRDYADRLAYGVVVYAGPGNNGGDAYIVAAQLVRAGVRVRLVAAGEPRTDDARRAATMATQRAPLAHSRHDGQEQLAVDGLLGTGHRGALRDAMVVHAAALSDDRARGSTIVALDIPSGLDATTGDAASGGVSAHVTLTYGTIKRGLLFARAVAGRIVLLDIGLAEHAHLADDAWCGGSRSSLGALLPAMDWNAHKGRRGHLALVGGDAGMAGAIVLATRAALASGIGLARACVDAPGVPALQTAVPQALARAWDRDDQDAWGHALAIGPGLGRSARSQSVMRATLDRNPRVPVVLDADALTQLTIGSTDAAARLREWCGEREAIVCTPHPGEFAQLLGEPLRPDWDWRAHALRDFAQRANATVLLKGTPTLIASPTSPTLMVMPRGSAVLATGGSGDLLTGIIGTLLAQGLSGDDAALVGATAHARAAELAAMRTPGIRGRTLDDVLEALTYAWREMVTPVSFPPGVLAEYPAPQ